MKKRRTAIRRKKAKKNQIANKRLAVTHRPLWKMSDGHFFVQDVNNNNNYLDPTKDSFNEEPINESKNYRSDICSEFNLFS